MTRQEEIVLARIMDMRSRLDVFEEAALKDLKVTYKTAADKLLNEVKAAKGKSARLWTNSRLIAMLEEAQLMHQAITENLSTKAAGYIAEAGAFSYKQINNITSWDGRVKDFDNVSMGIGSIKQLVTEQTLSGKKLDEWIGSALAPDIDEIKAAITTGRIQGKGFAAVVSRLQNELSIPKGSKDAKDLESVVKTYVQSMAVKAQEDVYAANKDIVEKVEWSAILEAGNTKTGRGTCPRCIALDGSQWETDDYSRPPCPLHVRCRCILLPVTKTWREMGFDIDEMEKAYSPWFVKDEKGKKIEQGRTDMSYHEWFASRGPQFQDNAIGPRRAQLYREGKLQLVDMVDNKGNLILLEDLNKVSFTIAEPIKKGYDYSDIGAASLFDEESKGTLGKTLSISDNCDE
jgi:hypothetical protein